MTAKEQDQGSESRTEAHSDGDQADDIDRAKSLEAGPAGGVVKGDDTHEDQEQGN
jgi:hypothetical protein